MQTQAPPLPMLTMLGATADDLEDARSDSLHGKLPHPDRNRWLRGRRIGRHEDAGKRVCACQWGWSNPLSPVRSAWATLEATLRRLSSGVKGDIHQIPPSEAVLSTARPHRRFGGFGGMYERRCGPADAPRRMCGAFSRTGPRCDGPTTIRRRTMGTKTSVPSRRASIRQKGLRTSRTRPVRDRAHIAAPGRP